MKKILLLAALSVSCYWQGNSQQPESPDRSFSCLYLTYEDAMNNKASYPNALTLNYHENNKAPRRSSYGIKISEETEQIKRSGKIVKESWGAVFQDTLYINKHPYTGINSFAKAQTQGRYLLIFSEVPETGKMQKSLLIPKDIVKKHNRMKSTQTTGMMFGAIGGAIAGATTKIVYFPLVIDTEDGSARAVSQEYIEILAERHPDISYPFSLEMPDEELVDYFTQLNNIIAGKEGGIVLNE